jgi:hypothetical protein
MDVKLPFVFASRVIKSCSDRAGIGVLMLC